MSGSKKKNKNRAVIIDGTNLFIIHYTANPAVDLNGEPIGGVVGTLNAVRNIVKTLMPTKVYFVWDGPGGSLKKRKILKEYKDGRKPVAGRYYEYQDEKSAKKNKIYQSELLKSFLTSLPICQIVTNYYEADDGIAYIVKNSKYFDHDSNIIVTCDKDFYQLINENTIIFNPMSKKLIDTEFVLDNFNIHPKNWLFYRSINGDKSDNIDGVKGFGPKTIGKLFPVDKESELIPESIKAWPVEDEDEKLHKKYEKLQEKLELITRNWELMDLSYPMISVEESDRLTQKIDKFKPTLSKKNFYIELMKLGTARLNPSFVYDFIPLLKK